MVYKKSNGKDRKEVIISFDTYRGYLNNRHRPYSLLFNFDSQYYKSTSGVGRSAFGYHLVRNEGRFLFPLNRLNNNEDSAHSKIQTYIQSQSNKIRGEIQSVKIVKNEPEKKDFVKENDCEMMSYYENLFDKKHFDNVKVVTDNYNS